MKWFRSNIKHGSRLALFALAIQFVLSFGHFHALAAQAAPAIQTGQHVRLQPDLAALDRRPAAQQQPAVQPRSDQQPGRCACAICAVMALASTVLFATPPLLLLPQAIEFFYLTTDAEFVI